MLAKLEQKAKDTAGRDSLVTISAHKEFILEALKKKYSIKLIHTVLKDEGLMPVSYQAFARAVRLYLFDEKPKPRTTSLRQTQTESDGFDPQAQREKIEKLRGNKQ